MNNLIILVSLALVAVAGCASIKDENGNNVGTCIGAGCVLRAAFGANTVDSKTGEMKGSIHLFSVPLAASAPVAASEQNDTVASETGK